MRIGMRARIRELFGEGKGTGWGREFEIEKFSVEENIHFCFINMSSNMFDVLNEYHINMRKCVDNITSIKIVFTDGRHTKSIPPVTVKKHPNSCPHRRK
jgi:hypothetical protein